METDEPEQPTVMQRLENAEREVNRMSGDIASLLQLLTNLTLAALPAGLAPAALPTSPAPESSAPATAAAAFAPEPKIGNPERFNGDSTQVRPFLISCRLQFSLQPRTFATEGAKVGTSGPPTTGSLGCIIATGGDTHTARWMDHWNHWNSCNPVAAEAVEYNNKHTVRVL
ncbi:uncharacterized protein LOC113744672 [Scomber scombrus]|uniref:Uncharacterized protein LOC113744672 n=1 Tax=Scomber scombrus TaxID=13677 RepID=A0AAV1MUV1_SCOSC